MSSDEEICVLCCREISIYATGSCDHPVCYECSTRMRVLCEQSECPICRSEMPYVIFTHEKQLFSSGPKFSLTNKKYTIAFEDRHVEKAFYILLQHNCASCDELCGNFEELKKHASRAHNLFYCDLCVDNLKIFSFERRQYTRAELAWHKRKGDPDNTSHRGHPLCEFCDKRFVDNDELYRHLRKEHFFCHFCDADGTLNGQFYGDYSYLKVHFRKEHYLCEEGECASQEFIQAFRSEIDFKAHKASVHAKNKSKAELMQTRTLDLEFSITPRNSANGERSPNHNDYRKGRYGSQNHMRKRNMDDPIQRETQDDNQNSREAEKKSFNTQCVQDFPSLVNGPGSGASNHFVESNRYSSCVDGNNFTTSGRLQPSRKNNVTEDFPALSTPSIQNSVKMFEHKKDHQQSNDTFKRENSNAKSMKVWSKPIGGIHIDCKGNNQGTARNPMASNLDEDFPKLKTRELDVPSTQNWNAGEWHKPKDPQKAHEDLLEEQLFQKCKSRKKKRNTTTKPEQRTHNQMDKVEPPSLSKAYTGLNNAIGNKENEVSHEKLDVKLFNKMERFRMQDKPKDDIPWRDEVHLVADDFPPLGPPVNDTAKYPPGFPSSTPAKPVAVVPPGFAHNSTPNNKSFSLSSIAQQLNSNTMLQSENNKELLNCIYYPPPDFQRRNSSLIDKILELAKSDNLVFEEFKLLSGNFRKGKISAAKYYTSCMEVLGTEKFLQLFSELLCLLPDIKKQQELLTIHNSSMKTGSRKEGGALPKQKNTRWDSANTALITCETCHQVLMKNDYDNHFAYHRNDENDH